MTHTKYTRLNGRQTMWKGEHTPLFQRLIWKLYDRFVKRAYIPKDTSIKIVRVKETIHPHYGEIAHIIISHNEESHAFDEYIFKESHAFDEYIFAEFLSSGKIDE